MNPKAFDGKPDSTFQGLGQEREGLLQCQPPGHQDMFEVGPGPYPPPSLTLLLEIMFTNWRLACLNSSMTFFLATRSLFKKSTFELTELNSWLNE